MSKIQMASYRSDTCICVTIL